MTLSLLALWFLQVERRRLGKKNPGVTVSLVRQILTELLRRRVSTVAALARRMSQKLRRTEEARIYHWYEETGDIPPPRPRPGVRPERPCNE